MRKWTALIFCWILSVCCGSTILSRFHIPEERKETVMPLVSPEPVVESGQGKLMALGKGQFHSEGETGFSVLFTEEKIEEILTRNFKEVVSEVEVRLQDPDLVYLKVTIRDPDRLPVLFPLLKPASGILQWLPECEMDATARLWGHENEILLDIRSAQISGLPVPESLLQSTSKVLNRNLKGILDRMEGLDIQVWKMDQGELKLEGRGPEKLIIEETEKPEP